MDLRQMSSAEIRALAYGLIVMLKLSDNYVIAVDQKGASFAVYTLPEKAPIPRSWWQKLLLVPECNGVCGFNLKRRHLTCGVCRWPNIIKGRLPPVVPVTVYFLAMGTDRQFEGLQRWLVKKAAALLEFAALFHEHHSHRK